MEIQHEFTLDEMTYIMTPANAVAAWGALKKAAAIMKGMEVSGDKPISIGTLLANLGDPVVNDIEKLIFEHTSVNDGHSTYRLSHKINEHFNKHRSHLINVLVEGVKYQFADFFSGSANLLAVLGKRDN